MLFLGFNLGRDHAQELVQCAWVCGIQECLRRKLDGCKVLGISFIAAVALVISAI